MSLITPGKLFLVGEYAVLEPGSLAILGAFGPGLESNIVEADQLLIESARWTDSFSIEWANHQLVWPNAPHDSIFVSQALTYAFLYLESHDIEIQPFHYTLKSPPETFQKGLGSSSAVVVATLQSVLKFHGLEFETSENKLKLFKLAYLAHATAQGKQGSGADVAAIVFGQITSFTSFESSAVLSQTLPLKALIDSWPWPHLKIESFKWPFENHSMAIAWTQKPASTLDFIEDYQYFKKHNEKALFDFVFSANATSFVALNALKNKDVHAFSSSLEQYRRILQELQRHFLNPIETSELTKLIHIAQSHEGVAKSSGAGGGDCGIALVPHTHMQALHSAWEKEDLTPLNLAFHG